MTASISAHTEIDMSTHTRDRMSARPQRIELITRNERRRRWSAEQKQAIVAESLSGDTSVTAVAQKHGIGTGQLYAWRHQLLTRSAGGLACFARVETAGEPRRLTGPTSASGLIEIALPGGTSIRVDAQVDEPALRRVLAALDRR